MKKNIYILLLILSAALFSCEKFREPLGENSLKLDQVVKNPAFTEGLLLKAYYSLPSQYDFSSDVASDDAITNDLVSVYRRMATGEWKSTFNPLETWANSYAQITYINKFLDVYRGVKWSTDSTLSRTSRATRQSLYLKKFNGEAHALRAYYKWKILQNHGGMGADGRLLGFPIIDSTITLDSNWKIPRSTYAECVKSIFNDLDTAIANLPKTWYDRTPATVQANVDTNLVFGVRNENRINGVTAQALKARVALLAASPAYSANSGVSWEDAAKIAGPLLKSLGSLLPAGRTFYKATTSKEILWNNAKASTSNWEQANFPPSLFGDGRTNPTQNLVDAFGMKNGYPINNTLSTYDPANPYNNRDPRLADFIVYNGSKIGSATINTYQGADKNGINVLTNSTRSGYYLKKLLLENVNLNPNSIVPQYHSYVFVRMTELLLNFAEAANEAWGPTGDPFFYGFSAKSKIQELRQRAGITQPDAYLNSINDQVALRDLIRNERRIELCFEGFRFWDIRRWNDLSLMQATVKAVYITPNTGSTIYDYEDVEERIYSPEMIYGPVPYNETTKYNLIQNEGW